jgi:hypothetical protein
MRRTWHRSVIGALAAAAMGCGGGEIAGGRCSFPTSPWDAGRDAAYQVHVSAGPGADELCVEARAPREQISRLRIGPRQRPFVRSPSVLRDGAWEPVVGRAGLAVECDEPSCVVRYRFALREAARALDDRTLALEDRHVIYAPASTWILRPDRAPRGARFRLRVDTAPGITFANGQFRAKGAAGNVYEGDLAGLDDAPYAAFGALRVHRVAVPGAEVEIAFTPGSTGLPPEKIVRWVETSARAVAAYYGRFPIERALLVVRAGGAGGVRHGSTLGDGGGSILLDVGRHTDEAELVDDWILVHEMVHLAFPGVLRPWAEEGLATYVEPIIRVRAGLIDRDEVWRSMVLGLPKGQPGLGDGGLERTDTWGRRYWGGALFWFLADLTIRQRTDNQRSLDDALRGVVAAGGNVAVRMDLRKTLELGDRAVGLGVLMELYRELGFSPVSVDLDDLFRRLGVSVSRHRVVYDDSAPLAAVRASITGRALPRRSHALLPGAQLLAIQAGRLGFADAGGRRGEPAEPLVDLFPARLLHPEEQVP